MAFQIALLTFLAAFSAVYLVFINVTLRLILSELRRR